MEVENNMCAGPWEKNALSKRKRQRNEGVESSRRPPFLLPYSIFLNEHYFIFWKKISWNLNSILENSIAPMVRFLNQE